MDGGTQETNEGAPPGARGMRADAILGTAIGAVFVLILLVLVLLWNGTRLDANEIEVVGMVRATRAEIISATRAQNDAEALAARHLATRDEALLDDYELARREARQHLAAAARLIAGDSDLTGAVAALAATVEARLQLLDGEIDAHALPQVRVSPEDSAYARFRRESEALQDRLNARIDAVRSAEDAAKLRLQFVSVLLGVLSLFASGLAMLALRRERGQWRLAQVATEAARARAQESDLAKTRFLAVASHDMRQPLHALTLYLSALERRIEGQEARDILTRMQRATQSMAGMFATLLDLARVQAGAVEPQIGYVHLQDVIDRVVAEHPGGQVEAQAMDVTVRTDPLLLERVLANLVVNALKHGGGRARLELRVTGDRARLCVADDGPGIAPADQARIFEEFVRLEGRQNAEGLGLGLAIVARITRLLDLPLELASTPGHGARFTLTLPLVAASAGVRRAPPVVPVALDGVGIVVCDDDAFARDAIAATLRDLGAVVRICTDEASLRELLGVASRPGCW